MPIVLKSGSLNLLEPSGPVQACNGTALPNGIQGLSSKLKLNNLFLIVRYAANPHPARTSAKEVHARENKCEHIFFRTQEIRFYVVWRTPCDSVRKMVKAKDGSPFAYCVTSLVMRVRKIANDSVPTGRIFVKFDI